MLVLPVFKLLYVLGVSSLTDFGGGILLIDANFLAPLWSFITHLPIFALLGLNNTLVAGGLALSTILCFPVYMGSKKGIVVLRAKYFDKIKNSKFIKIFLKIPIIGTIIKLSDKVKGR